MTCAEFKENVWGYAVGALEADEVRVFEGHLGSSPVHEGCREDLDKAIRLSFSLASAVAPVRPPKEAWARIEEQIRAPSLEPSRRGAPPRRAPWLVPIAAGVFAVVAGGIAIWFAARAERSERAVASARAEIDRLHSELDAVRGELEEAIAERDVRREALALLERQGVTLVALTGKGEERARAVYHPGEGRAFIVGSGMRRKPGKDYELWVIRGTAAPIPAGILRAGEDGELVAAVDSALLAAGPVDAFAISLEPQGGSSKPTEVLLVGAVRGG
jgi:anti-sigma-K factor RskA